MEEDTNFLGPKVPEGRCVAGDATLDLAHAFGAEARATLSDPERQPVARALIVMVAGPAGDVAVARQDRIIEEEPPDLCRLFVELEEMMLL